MIQVPSCLLVNVVAAVRWKVVVIRITGSSNFNSMTRVTRIRYVGSSGELTTNTPLVMATWFGLPSNPEGGGQPQSDCGEGQALSPPKLPSVFQLVGVAVCP